MCADLVDCIIADIAAPIKNALVGGPFGSNLVSKDYVDSGVPVIRGQNMGHGRMVAGEFVFVSPQKANKLSTNTARPGDLVFTQRGTLGQVAIVPDGSYEKYIVSQSQMKLTVDPKKADTQFLYYLFCSPEQQNYIKTNAIQVGVPHTNLGILRGTPITLPSIDNQREIAKILGSIDDKIELNRQINQTLEQIAQTIFKSWFVDFEPVKAKIEAKAKWFDGSSPSGRGGGEGLREAQLRAAMCAISGKLEPELDQLPPEQYQQLAATAALFPDVLVESELGLIPVGWEIRKVENLLSRLPSKVRYTKDQVKPYGVTPVFEQGSGILLGYHDGLAQFAATPEEPAFIFGDHTCVTHLACEPFDISQNVIPLKGSDRSTIWIYYAVKDKQVFQEYRRHWMELIVKDVVVPPESACHSFAKIATSFHLTLEANILQNRELATLRDTLLPKLLSGELVVGSQEGASAMETAV